MPFGHEESGTKVLIGAVSLRDYGRAKKPRPRDGDRRHLLQSERPEGLAHWYREHLGIQIEGSVGFFEWRAGKATDQRGHTVWSIFPADTSYFGKGNASFMINYRMKDLDGLLAALRRKGSRSIRKLRRPTTADSAGSRTRRETASSCGNRRRCIGRLSRR